MSSLSITNDRYDGIVSVALGSLILMLCSQVRIPIGAVPITMQTLGVFIVGLGLGSKRGFLAGLVYLAEATLGLPVLAGWQSNPLWVLNICSGYLISFPLAAWVIGWMREQGKGALLSIVCGQGVIYLCGLAPLIWGFGLERALSVGLLPFIVPGVLKALIAASLFRFGGKR